MARCSPSTTTRRYLRNNPVAYKAAMAFGSKPILPLRRKRKRGRHAPS